jgi:hypothetical protein
MKKSFLALILIISALSAGNAQFTEIGGGLALSSGSKMNLETGFTYKTGIIGISLKGIYKISLPVQLSPSLTVFYPHVVNKTFATNGSTEKATISTMMFDINCHYIFNSLDRFEFYGIGGFDILFARSKDAFSGVGAATYKQKDNALGLNLGAGTFMKINNKLDAFAEAKYVLSNYHQFMLNAGVLLNIDWMKKHENTDL